MPHSYTIEENVVERGLCQQVPSKEAGDMWFDESHRLCVVDNVSFERYVWEDVALWHVHVTAYPEEEITTDLRAKYEQFQQKRALELQRLKEEEDEKERRWNDEHKLRRVNIGVDGRFDVETYELLDGRILLRGCDPENNNASKVIVPKYVDRICDDAFQNNESIKELVFLNEKCEFFGGWSSRIGGGWFNDWPNLEKIVLPGQAKFGRDCVCFYGCGKLESIEFNGSPESSMYYAVFLPEAIVVYKKAKYYILADDIHATDDVAIGVSPRNNSGRFELPKTVGSITSVSLDFIYAYYPLITLIIPHELTIYCFEFEEYDDAAPLERYVKDPKEKEIILGKDTKINLVHGARIKTFKHIVEEGNSPTIQYGIRVFRGWGDKYGLEKEINDIRGLFTKNVKIIYR